MGIFKNLLVKRFTLNFHVTFFFGSGVGEGIRGDVHKYLQANQTYEPKIAKSSPCQMK